MQVVEPFKNRHDIITVLIAVELVEVENIAFLPVIVFFGLKQFQHHQFMQAFFEAVYVSLMQVGLKILRRKA